MQKKCSKCGGIARLIAPKIDEDQRGAGAKLKPVRGRAKARDAQGNRQCGDVAMRSAIHNEPDWSAA